MKNPKFYQAIAALILAAIFIILMFSGCASHIKTMDAAYKREYGSCPAYPQVKHFRKVSKRYNPEGCNYIY